MLRPARFAFASLVTVLACQPTAAPIVATPTVPPTPPQAAADRTIRRSVLMMVEHVAGTETLTVHADGTRDAAFEFNDRGRGPKLTAHVVVDAGGMPSHLDAKGVDYLKAPVDERFDLSDGVATWASTAEHGNSKSTPTALYVPLAGVPELVAVVVRALLHAPDRKLALLPSGEAHLERSGELTLEHDGKKRHVTRYEIVGAALEPDPVWLDDDGELFAIASDWTSVIVEGWEASVPELLKTQNAAQAARLESIAKSTAHRPGEAGLALTHARFFDVVTKRVTPDATIVIKGDRVIAVGPAASTPAPKGAETIDVKGRTVMAGLWDMHVHVAPLDGILHLAAGVTTVRDLGNDGAVVKRLRDGWAAGTTVGPRVLLAGIIDGRGPFQAPIAVFADTVEEGIADIDRYAESHYEQIKLYSSLKPELVQPLAAHAHKRGLRVSGHVPTGMTAEEAVRAGYDELQHLNFLFLNFLATKDDDTRTPLRFTRVADKGGSLDLASAPVRDFIALLKARGTVVDPTINFMEGMFTARPGELDPGSAPIAERVPAQLRRGFFAGGLPVPEGKDATYRASFAAVQKMTKLLFDSGVTIVAGTDNFAGFSLHRELELYEKAGIPPADILRIATIGAARVMKHDKDMGSIAPGKLADVIVVDGTPDVRVSDLRKVVTVIKGGVVHSSAALYASVSVK